MQDAIANVEEPPSSLLSAYNLKDGADGGSESNFSTQGSNENNPLPKEKEVALSISFDFLQLNKDDGWYLLILIL